VASKLGSRLTALSVPDFADAFGGGRQKLLAVERVFKGPDAFFVSGQGAGRLCRLSGIPQLDSLIVGSRGKKPLGSRVDR
jgi:hypothetical protein